MLCTALHRFAPLCTALRRRGRVGAAPHRFADADAPLFCLRTAFGGGLCPGGGLLRFFALQKKAEGGGQSSPGKKKPSFSKAEKEKAEGASPLCGTP